MTTHAVGTREEWLAARRDLLAAEKAHTRQGDELARQRMALPWVKVEKDYRFETAEGSVKLADLFRGRSQLIVQHFMLGAGATEGCLACSAIADGLSGFATHLANRDVSLAAVATAPFATLDAYRKRMGWGYPFASSGGTQFNSDFGVTFTKEEREAGLEYNFRREAPATAPIKGSAIERPGVSAFVLQDGEVYHTYSAYGRGVDAIWGAYQLLDRAPLGRNDKGFSWRRRDEYEA
ncbi:MAG: DUF899 domain-containing protein [bacterium]